jgi:hypothetical protein
MSNLTRLGKCVAECILLTVVIFSVSQQVFAAPIINFYGYKLTTKNTTLVLTFGVKGILSSDQIHVEIHVGDLATKKNWVYTRYYEGPGIYNATVLSPPDQPGQPFKVGDTYYATIYVYVPIHGGSTQLYEKDMLYTIQPSQSS